MFDTFREPHFFTFSVIFSHIASIFTFNVEFFSHLATFSHIAAFSHLRVPQGGCVRLCRLAGHHSSCLSSIGQIDVKMFVVIAGWWVTTVPVCLL